MLKQDVEIGAVYRVRWHDGSFTDVRITGERGYTPYGGYRRNVRYSAVNLATGRPVVIKSAAKLREKVG